MYKEVKTTEETSSKTAEKKGFSMTRIWSKPQASDKTYIGWDRLRDTRPPEMAGKALPCQDKELSAVTTLLGSETGYTTREIKDRFKMVKSWRENNAFVKNDLSPEVTKKLDELQNAAQASSDRLNRIRTKQGLFRVGDTDPAETQFRKDAIELLKQSGEILREQAILNDLRTVGMPGRDKPVGYLTRDASNAKAIDDIVSKAEKNGLVSLALKIEADPGARGTDSRWLFDPVGVRDLQQSNKAMLDARGYSTGDSKAGREALLVRQINERYVNPKEDPEMYTFIAKMLGDKTNRDRSDVIAKGIPEQKLPPLAFGAVEARFGPVEASTSRSRTGPDMPVFPPLADLPKLPGSPPLGTPDHMKQLYERPDS